MNGLLKRAGAAELPTGEILDDHPYDQTRTEVLPFLAPEAEVVLDVGCSRGGFCGSIKKSRPDITVWGIEPHADAAEQAREHADHVITGYFPDGLPPTAPPFDVVFFNDVLEHLVDPWGVLALCLDHLSADGVVVASIPNARNWVLIHKLVFKRDFSYTNDGILDRTHLRFFTQSTMIELFRASGYAVEKCEPINTSTSWKVRLMSLVFGSDIRHQQYVIVAAPRSDDAPST